MNKDDHSIFDGVAALYGEIRPRYPAKLFDDLFQLTGLSPEALVLDIGTGTGIAALPRILGAFPIHPR